MSFTVQYFVFMLPFRTQGNDHVTWNAIPLTQPQHKIMFIWRQVTRGKTSLAERHLHKPQRWTHPCRRCLSSNIFQEKMSQNITCPILYSRHSIIQPIRPIRNTRASDMGLQVGTFISRTHVCTVVHAIQSIICRMRYMPCIQTKTTAITAR